VTESICFSNVHSYDLIFEEISMLKVVLSMTLAAVLSVGFATPSYAVVLVTSDSGGSSIDVTGTATGGTASTVPYPGDSLTSINGVAVNIPLVTFNVIFTQAANGDITGSGTKSFGTGANVATLEFSITVGAFAGHFLLLDGEVTKVTANALTGYDFSKMVGADNAISIVNTGVDFKNIVGHNGALAVGSGFGLSETQAVPEPGSLTLLGLGLASFGAIGWKRRRKAAQGVAI
jgi:hypothetical protein